MYCQVKFRIAEQAFDVGDVDEEFGGIAEYDDEGNLMMVICGCCGSTFELEEVEILVKYANWMNLSDAIKD